MGNITMKLLVNSPMLDHLVKHLTKKNGIGSKGHKKLGSKYLKKLSNKKTRKL